MMNKPFVLGTRASPLALAQAELTRLALAAAFPLLPVELRKFTTRGDQKLDLNLLEKSEGGGKGLFTRELEEALIAGSIDVAVHSLKDLPGHQPAGLQLTAVLERAATADTLLCREGPEGLEGLEGLGRGATLGTSSIRRARQLQWLRPDLLIQEWRGNVQTRLRKLGRSTSTAGIVLAQAGLERLGFDLSGGILRFEEWIFTVRSLGEKLLPAIGQGAIALQSAAARPGVSAVLKAINHEPTFVCVRAERELQRLLSGDCSLPVGVRTRLDGDRLEMRALLFSAGSPHPATASISGFRDAPEALAAEVFAALERPAHPIHESEI